MQKLFREKLQEAILIRNCSDDYHSKCKKSAAYKLDSKCESICKDVLEVLQKQCTNFRG